MPTSPLELTSSNRIRTLVVVGPNEEELVRRSAACPAGGSASVEECLRCHRRLLVHLDPLERESYVRCDAPPGRDVEGGLATPVAEVIPSEVIAVRPDVPAQVVLTLLVERGFSGVPVVDERFRPIGVVSSSDLLKESYDPNGEESPVLREGLTARDVMTPDPITLEEDASVAEAASIMARNRVHRLPVVSEEGEVVGLVSTLDLLRFVGQLVP